NVAVVAAQFLLRAQLNAVVGKLALATLAVLARTIFPMIDGTLGATPHVLAHAAVDLVFRLVALGHRVLISLLVVRGSRPPLPRQRRDPTSPVRSAGQARGSRNAARAWCI